MPEPVYWRYLDCRTLMISSKKQMNAKWNKEERTSEGRGSLKTGHDISSGKRAT